MAREHKPLICKALARPEPMMGWHSKCSYAYAMQKSLKSNPKSNQRLTVEEWSALGWAIKRLDGCYKDSQKALKAKKLIRVSKENIERISTLRRIWVSELFADF